MSVIIFGFLFPFFHHFFCTSFWKDVGPTQSGHPIPMNTTYQTNNWTSHTNHHILHLQTNDIPDTDTSSIWNTKGQVFWRFSSRKFNWQHKTTQKQLTYHMPSKPLKPHTTTSQCTAEFETSKTNKQNKSSWQKPTYCTYGHRRLHYTMYGTPNRHQQVHHDTNHTITTP